MQTVQGHLDATGKKFALVVSRFNELISKKLLEGALDCLERHGASDEDLKIVWVPGSFEIPIAAAKLANSGKYDSVICLGAVIRGATPHFDFIAAEVAKGIAQTALQYQFPVAFGVLTTETIEQALERAGTKSGNKGWDAAISAIEMTDLWKKL
ncbi:6,7-dimethyl-8-ribityllumazine synthase [candidate division LCP-89 bacterium B3_LCP]|uniref:6,7-dimethyl-8-ribityllumazine synthase n=1 Tax=candidate division LCP-89 bacterium B3_LCP TaxID=2012998 RepID=A0A532V448_UNCL8|nr:MAG: 6,7-dimethyl-8-ribityllumazine synthase [candidate division LCP-89 bacterium B3_LCP]